MIQTSLLKSSHGDLVTDAAYDFYGLKLATCSLDQRIKTWILDETTGDWVNDSDWKAHDAPICQLSWAHPEYGTILASCSFDKTVKIWEEGGPAQPRVTEGNTGSKWQPKFVLTDIKATGASVRAIEFCPRQFGLKLAVLSSDCVLRIHECYELHNLEQWPLTFKIDLQTISTPSLAPAIAVSDGFGAPGTSLGASSNGGASAGNLRPGRREADGGWSLSWCKDKQWGEIIAVAAGVTGDVKVLQFTNSMSHDVIFTLPHSLVVSGEPGVGPAVNCVSWAPSCGRRYHLIATGGRDGKVKIWKISPPGENNRLTSEWVVNSAGTFDEHHSSVTRVEWNVTGTVLSSAGNDGNIRLWKATYGGNWRSMGYIHTEHGDEEDADMQE